MQNICYNLGIDCHTHTQYSKHASGSIEELVVCAIKKGIKILSITDHAPFPLGVDNRILMNELDRYMKELESVQYRYKNHIMILKGLECDFLPQYLTFTENMLKNLELDYVIGSIHYVILDKIYHVWDIDQINTDAFMKCYFSYLKELVKCGMFDCVGHIDYIMCSDINKNEFINYIDALQVHTDMSSIAWEINTSLKFKKSLQKINIFPFIELIQKLNQYNVSFTIGSDAHSPNNVGRDCESMINLLSNYKINNIVYFKNRQAINIMEQADA